MVRTSFPILTGSGGLDRDAIYWHYPHYNQHPQSFPSGVIRAGDWKLIEAFETGELTLYNLASDIGEANDLSAEEPAKVAELHAKMKVWRERVGADPMRPNPEFSNDISFRSNMKHRTISLLIVAVACGCTVPVSAGERPNILLIVSEDNGPELGCYGEPFVKTPVLDKLAEEGVRFHNAYVPQAGCSQSRAALLTGLYPHQNGQIGLATWKFRMYREDTPNIVRSLKQVGYRTGIIGKLHINPASAFPFDMKKIPSANFSRTNLGDYVKHAEEFFNAGDKPFFLSVNYPDAHRPFLTPWRACRQIH